MTTPQNYEPPSERALPGLGGAFEPEREGDADIEEPETSLPEEEDDELARREQDSERRAEDPAP